VLAETSNETPECLKKLNVHTIEAFVDFIWARAGEPPRPPSEEERQTVARWLIKADHTKGLQQIIWRNVDEILSIW